MEATTSTQVLIIGAGPTGLSLAAQLIRYGIEFVIVGKKEGCTELSKALVVHARTLEIYDQIGLAEKAVSAGQRIEKITLLTEGKEKARLDFSDFGAQMSPYPFPLIFEQSKNEHLLYDFIRNQSHDVLWQTEMECLTQDANGVKATFKGADGNSFEIAAQYLVGCDGASSVTRHLLNLAFEGGTDPRTFYVADVEMEFGGDRDSLYTCFGRDSFVILFPMQGDKHWRLVGNPPQADEGASDEILYGKIEEEVKKLVEGPLHFNKVSWFSTYRVHTRHTENFRAGRCFLAGDAAHIHTPVGGQGMNTGIQDAYNLAWKLALTLRGELSDDVLETYNEERLAVARQLLKSTDQMFDVSTAANWYLHFFRDHFLPGLVGLVTHFGKAREAAFRRLSQISIEYRESSLSQHGNGRDRDFSVKAGDRMPYFLANGVGIFQGLNAPSFHVLSFNDDGNNGGLKSEIEKRFSNIIDFQSVRLTPEITEIFGNEGPFLILLRPDNYVALISSDTSAGPVTAYLEKLVANGYS